MRCLVCGTQMKVREGPYGEFYYCSKGNHGTISVDKYNKIMAMHSHKSGNHAPQDDLVTAVERQTMALGGGVLTDVERFFVDNKEYNPEDFWQDIRPY